MVEQAIPQTKDWIISVILDQAIDISEALDAKDIETLAKKFGHRAESNRTLQNFNQLMRVIFNVPNARVVRLRRAARDRRLIIMFGEDIAIPSYDHLSAGQSTLLILFAPLLRYADAWDIAKTQSLDDITGIALIDEIDAHLHGDLQYRALPNLIKLFPKVQFIISAHSPFFLLGMRQVFGDEGFTIIDLPSGETIDAERYSEFEQSMLYLEILDPSNRASKNEVCMPRNLAF